MLHPAPTIIRGTWPDRHPTGGDIMATMSTIAVIGGGPRGISVLERIVAARSAGTDTPRNSPDSAGLTVHLVDDTEPGAGRVWRTNQTRTLCMNTLADAVTLFTEPRSSVTAPVVEGPTMYEWMELIRGDELTAAADPSGAKTTLFRAHRAFVPGEFHAEIAAAVPESHPSRALYGEYLRWVLSVVLARADGADGADVDVQVHQARATGITASGTQDRITLVTGDTATEVPDEILADATVLATGWTDTEPDALETFTASSLEMHPELTWVRPGNPADQAVDDIPSWADSHEEVLVRGLGMGFFDLMAMLTIDRGGRFVPDATARSGLSYRPSGREPHLLAASHHGYPYQPKPVFHSLPPAAWTPRFRAAVARLRQDAPADGYPADSIDFGTTLWPAILRDAQEAYYRVLLGEGTVAETGTGDLSTLDAVTDVIDDPDADPWTLHTDPRLVRLVPEHRFNLPMYADPVAGLVAASEGASGGAPTVDDLTARVADLLGSDLHEAELGRASAVKAGLQVIGSVRKPAQVVDEPGRFTTRSRRAEYAELRRVGQMVGSGPPAFRTAELLCLVDAGYVRFLGGHPTLVIDPEKPAFAMSSPSTGEETVTSRTLVDAWLHKPDTRTTADPLSRDLREAGRLRTWTRGDGTATHAPEVDLATSRLIGASGEKDPRVHLVGIPLQDVRADMTISPMPRTDPLMLQETDAAAVSALHAAG